MRGSVRVVVVVVVLAIGLVAATSAQAFKYVDHTTTLTTGGSHTVSAKCPGKQRVLGGGETNDLSAFDDRVALTETFPFDGGDRGRKPDDGWTVSVDLDGTVPVGLTAHAICAKGTAARKLRYRSNAESVDGGQEAVEASCPKRARVVSGGLGSTDPELGWVASTAPADGSDRNGSADDGWEGTIDDYDGPVIATTYAVCAKGKFGRKLKRTSDPEVVEPNTEGVATASCPGKTKVVGGGLESPSPLGSSIFNATGPSGHKAWTGVYDQYAPEVTITAHAICHA
jgi:hypothetical protein